MLIIADIYFNEIKKYNITNIRKNNYTLMILIEDIDILMNENKKSRRTTRTIVLDLINTEKFLIRFWGCFIRKL